MISDQNLTDHELFIPNVGFVPANGIIEIDLELNSSHQNLLPNAMAKASMGSLIVGSFGCAHFIFL